MINSPRVCVQVQSVYIETHSQPEEERYVFAYTVTIRNLGRSAVQLLGRYWLITNGNGRETEVQGEGVWLDMEGTFSWGKPQITVRAMRYRFPGVHRVLTALVDSDRSTVWVMVSRTQLLTVDCADQTLYYRDGQLVDRYIVQENPDGTFDYAYGTDQEYGIDYKKG